MDFPLGNSTALPTPAHSIPINQLVKTATAELHQSVEQRLSAILFATTLSPYCYLDVLRVMQHCYSTMEHCLKQFPTSKKLLIGRSKLGWLEEDIAYLTSLTSVRESDWESCCTPMADTRGQAMGMMYVMEGSTLGGHFINNKLRNLPWLSAGQGLQFFSNYGSSRTLKWKQFIRDFQTFYQHHPEQQSNILDGAQDAFNTLYTAMDSMFNER